MSEKRLTGEARFHATNEHRPPKMGEWFVDLDGDYRIAKFNYAEGHPRPILRLVEDFAEVERPSAELVEFARLIARTSKQSTGWPEARAKAAEILRAEAAFADQKCAVCNGAGFCNACNPCNTDPDPQDLAFARKCADLNKPHPVDASDAVTAEDAVILARLLKRARPNGDLFDAIELERAMLKASNILKRSETK